ncbi:MAG: SufD family Fe-S cluster assembly protein [bacterium]
MTIQPGISKAEGSLLEENVLLGEKIVVDVKPLLDVKSNDVVASHGATIQRLDPQKLFYLNAKGLSGAAATTLMVQAYVQRAYDHVEEDSS